MGGGCPTAISPRAWAAASIAEEDARLDYGEQRINPIGMLRGTVVFMAYTERGDDPSLQRFHCKPVALSVTVPSQLSVKRLAGAVAGMLL